MTLKLIFKLQNLQRALLDRYIKAKSKDICAINSTIHMLVDKRVDVENALADAYEMKGKM